MEVEVTDQDSINMGQATAFLSELLKTTEGKGYTITQALLLIGTSLRGLCALNEQNPHAVLEECRCEIWENDLKQSAGLVERHHAEGDGG